MGFDPVSGTVPIGQGLGCEEGVAVAFKQLRCARSKGLERSQPGRLRLGTRWLRAFRSRTVRGKRGVRVLFRWDLTHLRSGHRTSMVNLRLTKIDGAVWKATAPESSGEPK